MSFYIQSVEIGGPRPFYLLGPCSLECESFVWEMAVSYTHLTLPTICSV